MTNRNDSRAAQPLRGHPAASSFVILVAIWAAAMWQAVPALAQSRRAEAAVAFQRAMRLRVSLETHRNRSANDYLRVVHAFESVYRADPGYPKTPSALAAAAEVYEEMGRQFASDRYYSKAIETYQFVAAQYPGGSLAIEALDAAAGIYLTDLENPIAARDAYEKFLKIYPHSQRAPAARAEVARLNARLARWPTKAAPPRTIRASSRGAAVKQGRLRAADEIMQDAAQPVSGSGPFVLGDVDDCAPGIGSVSGHGFSRAGHGQLTSAALAADRGLKPGQSSRPVAARLKPCPDTLRTNISGALSAPVPARGGLQEVESVHDWVGPNYTRVVIGANGPVTFNALHLENPPRLVFDIAGARLSAALARKVFPVENGFLKRVRIAQYSPTVTRVVLDVPQIEDYSVFSLPNPFRLIIDIHGASPDRTAQGRELASARASSHSASRLSPGGNSGFESSAPAASKSKANAGPFSDSSVPFATQDAEAAGTGLRPSRSSASLADSTGSADESGAGAPDSPSPVVESPQGSLLAGTPTLTRALGLKIRRIVIDPGHGGHDTGTIGPTGLEEKNVVLDVGLRLRKLIERKMGCQVIMTRSTDTFIPLEERTAIANEYGADLFISIHANASRDAAARGVEVYYLNFTSDPEALEIAARENATSQESVFQLQSLIKKIALSEKIGESRDFAQVVDARLTGRLDATGDPQRDRGVKKAPFVVLIGANMPSILAEISFLTNPHDERLLREPAFRQQIAQGLYNGILRYANSLGTIRVAERGPM